MINCLADEAPHVGTLVFKSSLDHHQLGSLGSLGESLLAFFGGEEPKVFKVMLFPEAAPGPNDFGGSGGGSGGRGVVIVFTLFFFWTAVLGSLALFLFFFEYF